MGWQDNPVIGQQSAVWASNPEVGASPPPAPSQSLGQKITSGLQGIRQGFYDIPQSAMELGVRGTDAIGLTHGVYPEVHKFFKDTAEEYAPGINTGNNYAGGGRIAGQVAGTLPLAAVSAPTAIVGKAPMIAKALTGAAQGAAGAGLTSSSSDAPLGTQLAVGAAAGGALPILASGAKLAGRAAVGALGETTGAGSASLKNAFTAGRTGGDKSSAFIGSMRGNIPWSSVVEDAKTALGNMRAQRGAAYRSGMADISKDAIVLSFEPVDEAIAKTNSIKTFKGVDTSPKTADVRGEIDKTISDWKGLDPKEYHTPEGFDALKQMIGDIRDNLPFNTPQRAIADNAYNAVRSAIAKQAPTYDKVMTGYSAASDELSALQKELFLGQKGNPNTALRKLQSVMRDNANTSWGDRTKYASRLSENGAPNLMPSLAGQALSTPIPRGLAKYADAAGLAAAASHNPLLLLAAPLGSPRLMGETFHGAGAAVRGATNLAKKVPFQLPALPQGALSPAFGAVSPWLFAQTN